MTRLVLIILFLLSSAWSLECPEWNWHTHYVNMGYCVTYNGQTYINDVEIPPNGDTPPTHDGWQTCVEIDDGCVPIDSIDRIDTLYITDTLYVPDTTISPVIMYDTTVIPVEAFDTTRTQVEIFDTTLTSVTLYDTTNIAVDIFDTTQVPVDIYDTTYREVVIYDTAIVPVSRYDTIITEVTLYDTTLIEVALDDTVWAYDTIAVTTYDTIIAKVDSFYNVGVERSVLDTFYVIGIDQFTTEYRFDHGLSGSPMLIVGVDLSNISDDEELEIVVDVNIYDQIGQFVDQMRETRVVDHSGGDIEIYEEFIVAKETERGLVTGDGKRYGTGVYILRGAVQILVDGRKLGTVAEQKVFGHRR